MVAEEQGHHPDLHLTDYRTVTAEMTTHAAKGLTENDFIMAAKVGHGRWAWASLAGRAPGRGWLGWCGMVGGQGWWLGRVRGQGWWAEAAAGRLCPEARKAARKQRRHAAAAWCAQINDIDVADLLPKRKPKFWA